MALMAFCRKLNELFQERYLVWFWSSHAKDLLGSITSPFKYGTFLSGYLASPVFSEPKENKKLIRSS